MLPFENGEPVAKPDNNSAITDIFGNADNSVCPDSCFRPVGMAFDGEGRLFVSSDATGEIYVVERDSTSPGATSTASSSSLAKPSATSGSGKSWPRIFALPLIIVLISIS